MPDKIVMQMLRILTFIDETKPGKLRLLYDLLKHRGNEGAEFLIHEIRPSPSLSPLS